MLRREDDGAGMMRAREEDLGHEVRRTAGLAAPPVIAVLMRPAKNRPRMIAS